MFTKLKTTTVLTATLMFSSLAGCAEAQQNAAPANKAEIEQIVRAYLLENPEVIEQALVLLDEKRNRQSIVAVAKELRKDKRDFSIGANDAKVTMVEFFDYNCSFCKQSTAWVQSVIKKYPADVRVVFKELPILERRTKTSRNAAKAALAAKEQGKYMEMHFALMDGTALNEKFINSAAVKIGLNMSKFKKDMADPKLDEQLEDAMYLASRIPGLTGTPFFVINDKFLASGNTLALQALLDEALAE
ncbi:MAG: thioredoxin domain-containing protein [Robiginitomaculum sp.]|nr:thioredoxin domain-containing protein [Robiginitomaculum sp.]